MAGLGRVYKRKDSRFWWIELWVRGKRHAESSKSTRRRDAEELLRMRVEQFRLVPGAPFRYTLEAALRDYLTDAELREARGIRDLRRSAKLAAEILGPNRKIIDLGALDLHAFQRGLSDRGYAANTVNKGVAVLMAALRFAARTGRLPVVPQAPKRLPPAPPRQGFIDYDAFLAIDAELPDWAEGPWRFGYWTGWRRREVLHLTWAEVGADEIRLDPARSKNRASRVLPLVDDVAEIIESRRLGRLSESRYVFHRAGRRISMTWYYTIFSRACEAAGYRGIYFHDTRRSISRDLVRSETPTRVAMDVTGHKSRALFDQYNITSAKDLEEAQRRLGEYRRRQRRKILPFRQKEG